jgi:hypothetical protein
VPEGVNIEVAQHLNEGGDERSEDEPPSRALEIIEIAEALLLAFVTIATAWSGYQAARWDGRNALRYGQASKDRALATQLSTAAGQIKLYDVVTFNTWVAAVTDGKKKLAALYVKRFSPEYRVAFDAWLKMRPATNPNAPAGPSFMPQYKNKLADRSQQYNNLATAVFQEGTDARETGDEYIRTTVFLASILFLIALSQRFKIKAVRRGVLAVAFGLLIYATYALFTYPVA